MYALFFLALALVALTGTGGASETYRRFPRRLDRRLTTTTTTVITTITTDNSTANGTTDGIPSPPLPPPTYPAASPNSGTAGFKTVGYYASWSVYQNFTPADLQTDVLTHLIYAFGGVMNETGTAHLLDPWADVEMKFPGDGNATNATTDLYGIMGQLYQQKKRNRNLKTLLSFGGWNMVANLTNAFSTPAGRQGFATSAVGLMLDHGFDGIDIDWEYPSTPEMAQQFVDVCDLVRTKLDQASSKIDGRPHFLLTLAVGAGAASKTFTDVAALNPSIDFLNLMAYDYAGSWSNFSGHQANVFNSMQNPRSTEVTNTQSALDFYLGAGLPSWKLILGLPLYGHVFNATAGPGTPFNNSDPTAAGTNYNQIPLNNVQVDRKIMASWTYNNATKQMISFDNVEVAKLKADYLKLNRLGGAMFWALDGDRPLSDRKNSIIGAVTDELYRPARLGMEQVRNNLKYPDSPFASLRAGGA